MVDKKDLDALSRRVFLRRGTTIATVAPFVINLSACAGLAEHGTGLYDFTRFA